MRENLESQSHILWLFKLTFKTMDSVYCHNHYAKVNNNSILQD